MALNLRDTPYPLRVLRISRSMQNVFMIVLKDRYLASCIGISCDNSKVVLRPIVSSLYEWRAPASNGPRHVNNEISVYNDFTVEGPRYSYTHAHPAD